MAHVFDNGPRAPRAIQAFGDLVLPGTVQNLADAINADVSRLDYDISTSNVRDAFKSSWSTWKEGWDAFYANISDSWWTRAQNATIDAIQQTYPTQLRQWQSSFKSEGGRSTGADVAPEPDTSPFGLGNPFKDAGKLIPWIIGGVAIVVFGPAVVRALNSKSKK